MIHHVSGFVEALTRAYVQPVVIGMILITNLIIFGCAGLFYLLESTTNSLVNTYFDALWWSFCTITTVGYGDIVPLTTAGKATGMILMIVGVTMFICFTAVIASYILTFLGIEKNDLESLERRITHLESELKKKN